ncbi:single-stranded-DNA-specific exonuclease RecJ [Haliovirga abyssi]|uniref:Single-stranded-DNA-specific exonuclease RecJ n=1 Tax=Haliovirga abyssi TaxID=2996794 RepID=A0AAU9D9I9_9FUSO|nr:single-stranded-DNA-specific exonuclease RecJ [Haliovirga abyssi]BDU49960.1 single-stranded-DNA-specific exonuclease RecJ [Haliovirga abyssi]
MEWDCVNADIDKVRDISKKYNISQRLGTILNVRNITLDNEIKLLLDVDYKNFNSPFDFEDMEEVVKCILEKREEGKKIFIYGDYDVDGITSVAFLVIALRNIGFDVGYYIPNRMEEGYGLNKKSIEYIKANNGNLIITVDIGINSEEEINHARKLGMDIIVTDHHKVLETDNYKVLTINPKISKNYKFEFLAGAGVALKLAQAIYIYDDKKLEDLYKFIDIVMIGTVADVMPLSGENRIIVKKGLELINNSNIKGLKYLIHYLRLDHKKISTSDISFNISPMLNALGRIKDSKIGVDFFLEEDEFKIYNIIEEMKEANKTRRSLERKIYQDVEKKLKTLGSKKYIFYSSSEWHPGVIGVVAARISLKYKLPTILISINGDYGKASCRSVKGINIFEILNQKSDKFIRFGGHDFAVGFIAKKDNLEELENHLKNRLENFDVCTLKKRQKLDMEIKSLEEINEDFFEDMDKLAPFGLENEQPVFLTKGVYFDSIRYFGVDMQHFKCYIRKDNMLLASISFNIAHKLKEILSLAQKFDIIYYPEKIWNKGEEIVQLKIKDFKESIDENKMF